MDDKTKPLPPRYAASFFTACLGMYLIVLILFLVYLMVNVWPETEALSPSATALLSSQMQTNRDTIVEQPAKPEVFNEAPKGALSATKNGRWKEHISLRGNNFRIHDEARMLIIVLLGGAIGAMIHAIQSFIQFVGFRKFITSWIWWYIMRAPIGAALALAFYFALRGGLLSGGGAGVAEQLSVAGVASLSTMVGLFTEQAVNKLSDVFDTLFAPKDKEHEGDGIHDSPIPISEITELCPEVIKVDSTNGTLIVKGKNFRRNSKIRIDGTTHPTGFISETELETHLDLVDLGAVGSKRITVVDTSGAESNTALLMIEKAQGQV